MHIKISKIFLFLCLPFIWSLSSFAQEVTPLQFFRIGAGVPTGSAYALGSAIAGSISAPPNQSKNCIDDNPCGVPGLVAVAQSRAGSIENIQDVVNGDIESAIVYADISREVFQADLPVRLRGDPKNLRMIADLATLQIHIITHINSGINRLEDIRGKRVAAGVSGSAQPLQFSRLLQAAGMSLRDIIPVWNNLSDASEKILQGNIDAIFVVGSPPLRIAEDILAAADIKLLSIDDAIRDKLVNSASTFYSPTVIPAGTYRGQVKDINTLGLDVVWLVQKNVDAELVYQMTRALWNPNTEDFLYQLYPDQELKKPTRKSLHEAAVPLHEGAIRYYKNIGLLE